MTIAWLLWRTVPQNDSLMHIYLVHIGIYQVIIPFKTPEAGQEMRDKVIHVSSVSLLKLSLNFDMNSYMILFY